MMKRWQAVKRLLPLMAMFALVLSGCGREDLSVLRPQGPVAQGQLDLIKLHFDYDRRNGCGIWNRRIRAC